MYTITSVVLICLPLLALTQKPSFCGTRDCPSFNVTETNPDRYEVRLYEHSRWVTTDYLSGDQFRVRSPFMRLFRYIRGNNNRDIQIRMTKPVLRAIRPEGTTMMFYVPSAHVPNTPIPNDSLVRLVDVPEKDFYVRVFHTDIRATPARYREELQILKDFLGSTSLYNTSVSYTAGYHSPRYTGTRHNEVWLEKL